MTQEQIVAMSDIEFALVPPEERRSCHDCRNLKGVVNLYCTNKIAIKDRGTSIPGCIRCPHWVKQETKEEELNKFIIISTKLFSKLISKLSNLFKFKIK